MQETLKFYDGLGLAAPQVGRSVGLFLVRKPVEKQNEVKLREVKIFINPEILSQTNETWMASEGCLSIPCA